MQCSFNRTKRELDFTGESFRIRENKDNFLLPSNIVLFLAGLYYSVGMSIAETMESRNQRLATTTEINSGQGNMLND